MHHIIIINYTYHDNCHTADQWLADATYLTDWAESVQGSDVKVTVFQRFTTETVIHRANVTYHLIMDGFGATPHPWQIPRRLHWSAYVLCTASLQAGYATLVHINGLHFPFQILHVRSILPASCAVTVQHHGEQPWPLPQRLLQQWSLRQIDGFIFASAALAQTWVQQKVIGSQRAIYTIPHPSASSTQASAHPQTKAIYEEIFFQRGIALGKT